MELSILVEAVVVVGLPHFLPTVPALVAQVLLFSAIQQLVQLPLVLV
jgi:hypothetical protein